MTASTAELCKRCHALNVVWAASSPLWNYVMRGNNIDGEALYDDMVCIPCFIYIAEVRGLTGQWRLTLDPEPEGLIYETPSGRVWDPEQFLWVTQ